MIHRWSRVTGVAMLVTTLAFCCAGDPAGEGGSSTGGAASAPGETTVDPNGDLFAALDLHDVHGKLVDLDPYRGRVRVFDIWASWCGPCRAIIPELNDLYARYRAKGLVVIGMSLDEYPAAVVMFERRIPLRYPNGMFNEQAAKLFGYPTAVPTTFLVDREGVIRRRFVGYVNARILEKAVLDLL